MKAQLIFVTMVWFNLVNYNLKCELCICGYMWVTNADFYEKQQSSCFSPAPIWINSTIYYPNVIKKKEIGKSIFFIQIKNKYLHINVQWLFLYNSKTGEIKLCQT